MWTFEKLVKEFGYTKGISTYRQLLVDAWNIIGDNYKICKDFFNKEVVVIPDQVYNKAKSLFDGNKEKNPFNYKSKIDFFSQSEYDEKINRLKRVVNSNSRGIYGIYRNGELIYIGKTEVSFEVRERQHRDIIEGRAKNPGNMKLYQITSPNDVLEFKPLIDIDKVKVDGKLTSRDIQSMELALISLYKPIGNWQGVNGDYKYK